MRIGIDVRYLSHGLVGGIHTYLKSLIPNLIQAGSNHEFYLYADTKRSLELTSLPDYVTVRLLPYHNLVSTVYNDLFMQNQIAKDNLEVMHFPGSYGFGPKGPSTVVTLQDEINVLPLARIIRSHRKTVRTIVMMSYLHFLTNTAIQRANKVITVSEYSKQQIARYSGIHPDKLVVIPHACPPDIQRIEDTDELADVRQRLNITKPFFLAEAFKNPGVIVRAWRLLSKNQQENTEIIFFSRSPEVLPIVHEAVKGGFARLLVRPVRRDLSALFSMAEAFVFPSWIEGFGIPLLEAMTCGAPIIASDRGSIPEVAGDAAWLMDAEDQDKLAAYLNQILTQPAERQALQERGFARVAQYSWPRIIQQVLNTYQQSLAYRKSEWENIENSHNRPYENDLQ
jgi:glycosyltransferase involved in cell wall biosynthesis